MPTLSAAALAALSVLTCISSVQGRAILLPRQAATNATSNGSSGCGQTPIAPIGSLHAAPTFQTQDGISRQYNVFLPQSYNSSKPTPIVFLYSGSGETGSQVFLQTDFGNSTLNPNAIVIAPEGLPGRGTTVSWEGASYSNSSANDTAFTNQLLDHLETQYCIDTQRVYATGFSNGGGFVDVLACSTVGARFAAFAPVSGAYYTDVNYTDCRNVLPVTPMLEFHGGSDTNVPYTGNKTAEGGIQPPVPQFLSNWGRRNGCNATAGVSVMPPQYNGIVNYTTYSCGNTTSSNSTNIVQGYWLKNWGHAWPSTTPNVVNQFIGYNTTAVSATPLMLQFFANYTVSGRQGTRS